MARPTGLIRFFTNKRALIPGKSRKLSGQLFLTFDYEGLCTCWYIFNKCKNISFSQFDWQLVNHRPWIWHHLFSHSIFADFEIEYLSLPESYDNFVIPCLNNPLVYNKHKKNFWALPFFCVRCQLKTTPKTDLFPLHLSYSSTVNGCLILYTDTF